MRSSKSNTRVRSSERRVTCEFEVRVRPATPSAPDSEKQKARDVCRGRRDLDRSSAFYPGQIRRARPIKSGNRRAERPEVYRPAGAAVKKACMSGGRMATATSRSKASGRRPVRSAELRRRGVGGGRRVADGRPTRKPLATRVWRAGNYFLWSAMYLSANCSSGALRRPIIFASSVAFGTSHPSCRTRLTSHAAPTRLAEAQ
jgi:hypothetical protein